MPTRSAAASLTDAPVELQRPISSPASLAAPAKREKREPRAVLRRRRKGWRLRTARTATRTVMRKHARRCWSLSAANHSSPFSIFLPRSLSSLKELEASRIRGDRLGSRGKRKRMAGMRDIGSSKKKAGQGTRKKKGGAMVAPEAVVYRSECRGV
ncbi:hypothetical protein COCNU_01G004810 [Cocos nucifera]|uniref:Uncharacterized protein n=1 Tax=Cocos nucifera TaxID=13894 RepID=A0A8K0MU75_COCNU|nr:hypothetical protein COCNU_01G004810 [Cocos nucifera]